LRIYYRESICLHWWIWILFVGAIAFPSSILVVQSFLEPPAWWKPAPVSALLILIVTFGLIFLNFAKLSIKVDSEKISVRYGLIKKTISWNEVVSCEPTRADLGVYLGVGIRLGVDNSLAFTTSFGSAVRIVRSNGRSFVFSTNNPEKLSKIINEISKARALRSSSPSKIL